jgi:ATP-dependent helicase/nuclease subunit A
MNHDELVGLLELELAEGFRFTDDQADVMYAFQEGTGRVAVGSGAGTGKTATLTRVVAESITRMTQPEPGSLTENPFDKVLVTTFTRDAAGQLKGQIKQLLRVHESNGGTTFDSSLWRWLETDSNISTIDSFVGDLLREIASEVHVAPGFDVRDEIETADLLRDIERSLREEDRYDEAFEVLEDVLSDTSPRRYLFQIQQKLREACYEFPEPNADPGTTIFESQMRSSLHNDREPPFSDADIRNIVSHVTGMPEGDVSPPSEDFSTEIEGEYYYNVGFASALDELLDAFEAEYDTRTRQTGQLTYQDIVYIVWEYLEHGDSKNLRESLSERFSKIFIDEFQDTSYAQCRILSYLITNDENGADVLVIGDVKQSIYSWRSADPEIFAHILEHAASDEAEQDTDDYLEVNGWTRTELVTNFRSHPHLVRAGNHLFDRVFQHGGWGGIGTFPIDFQPLRPFRPPTNDTSSHLHIIPLGDVRAEEWRTQDPQQTAATIRGLVENDSVTVGDGDDQRPVKAGDVTLLFRQGTHMQAFRSALDDYGLKNAIVANRGLFATREIGFVVDILDWFASPHSKDSLLRILRSPVTALSDRTLRFLAKHDWNLPYALEEWVSGDLNTADRERLAGLVDLRNDLRWDREGSKAELIQKIIQHTGLEAVLLAGDDAMQRYGNLWVLVELARDWEDEELLPYREFVDRLQRYRDMARSNNETFELAQTADSSAEDTVKLRTVHSSKGLEFDVVVLPDLLAGPGGRVQSRDQVQFRDPETRKQEFAVAPRPRDEPVSYDEGPGRTWINTNYRSTLWLAPDRDGEGQFQYDHPFNPAIHDEFGEFWRLLYVAFTRASDHLILPLGDDITYHNEWSSWAHPLLEVFKSRDEWQVPDDSESLEFNIEPSRMELSDDPPLSIPLNVGLLEQPALPATESVGLPELDETPTEGVSDAEKTWEGMPFAPRQLNPSTLHDLIACPRRYQYRALQEVSEARGESPPGSNAPDGYSPSYWGTLVHEGMEALHKDVVLDEWNADSDTWGEHVETYLQQEADVRTELEAVLESYRESELWQQIVSADTVLPEYELSAVHPQEPQVHLSGLVDLLLETSSGWRIVDFKTGEKPREHSYLENQYRWQLATYAWMLKAEYGIEVTSTELFYVQNGDQVNIATDWTAFGSYLSDLPDYLTVTSEKGLPVQPEPDPKTHTLDELDAQTRCGSCPYTSICDAWSAD